VADYEQTTFYPPNLAGLELPFSLEAEQSVLGAVLVDAGCLPAVMDELRANNFYRPENARLFEIMTRLFTTAQPIDFVTVLETACTENVFPSDADAKVYLAQLIQIVPSTANVGAYAKIVREKSYLRSLIMAAQEIIDNSRDSGGDPQTLLDSAEQKIYDIRQGRNQTASCGWIRSSWGSMTGCKSCPAITGTTISASPPGSPPLTGF
jgi:replicative DNA helicase